MIEILRQGFRLDLPSSQVVTFKKAQNLNGIQNRYAYSNTFAIEKTENNKKLLGLTDLPAGKLSSLQNGYEVDVIINSSVFLRNQTLKITKETKTQANIYLLYSDSSVVSRLKSTYINTVVQDLKYKKTTVDFNFRANAGYQELFPVVFVQAESEAGQYVVEEMPQLINLRWIINKMFTDIGYTMYGDFAVETNPVREYFVAPNAGIYQVYGGTGAGFSPSFDVDLTAFDLLNQTLAYFNCYASVDDTLKTVIINQWTNLGNYKSTFKDYSRFFVDYQDFEFQGKLAKINELTYSDSEPTFNSFFFNNLSSEERSTYLASKFGSGALRLFEDSEIQEDGTIPVRANGEPGETSALRIYKIDKSEKVILRLFSGGNPGTNIAYRAVSVPMRTVFDQFHKGYVDFILTPLIQMLTLRYDAILANDFSLTEVFFIEQQAAYWIPLEINFSTKKDEIKIKAMLIKKRKVESPFLKNFNSILLDFKQASVFSKTLLLRMYPTKNYKDPIPLPPGLNFPPSTVTPPFQTVPANEYPWESVIFTAYDQALNRVYINGVLLPANSLPQTFLMSDLTENSIVIEANQPSDTQPDTNTGFLYLKAVDTNGGVSNEAYITIRHSGIARLESNFRSEAYSYERSGFSNGVLFAQLFTYYVGGRPNLNDTFIDLSVQELTAEPSDPNSFNMIESGDDYGSVRISMLPLAFKLTNTASSGAEIYTRLRVIFEIGGVPSIMYTAMLSAGEATMTGTIPGLNKTVNALPPGATIKAYFRADFLQNNVFGGSRTSTVELTATEVAIVTIKTV